MKPKLKQYLKITAIFSTGLAIGIVIMGYLSLRASRTFLEVFRANYSTEQYKLAAQAHRDDDKYSEYVYRRNAADILTLGRYKAIDKTLTTWTFTFPFIAPVLDHIAAFPDPDKAHRATYGMELARLAEATENIGFKEKADNLWAEAAELTGYKDIARLRGLVEKFHQIENKADAKNSKKQ